MIKRKVFYISQRVYSEYKGNKYDYLFTRIEDEEDVVRLLGGME